MNANTTISPDTTMGEILAAYPGAQRALMRRYHIGGCSSCGFALTERLSDVLARHNVLDTTEVIEHIKASHEQEQRIQLSPTALAEELRNGQTVKLIDCRSAEEREIVQLDGSVPATRELFAEITSTWPKDAPIVTYCHKGMRSLEAASFLIGHGFRNVWSLRGGIDAWVEQVDPTLPRY